MAGGRVRPENARTSGAIFAGSDAQPPARLSPLPPGPLQLVDDRAASSDNSSNRFQLPDPERSTRSAWRLLDRVGWNSPQIDRFATVSPTAAGCCGIGPDMEEQS